MRMSIQNFPSSSCTSANPLSICTVARKPNTELVNNMKSVNSLWFLRYNPRRIKLISLRLVHLVSRYPGQVTRKYLGLQVSESNVLPLRPIWRQESQDQKEKTWNQSVNECAQSGRKECETSFELQYLKSPQELQEMGQDLAILGIRPRSDLLT